jgi:uncharacterized protein YbaR (Trm112 family)
LRRREGILLALIVCQRDRGYPLRAVAVRAGAGGIEEGELAGPSCERRFPISAGIPRFVPPEHDDLSEISRREMEIRDSKRAQRATPSGGMLGTGW